MVQKRSARRGRPRTYDPDRALREARDLFWSRGFAATSLDDLSAATRMNRPSLYGAFGDKRALYHAAMAHYRRDVGAELTRIVAEEAPLRETLMRIYRYVLDIYFPEDGQPRGCFIVSIGVAEAQDDADARRIAAGAFEAFDGLFEKRFRDAVRTGELPGGTDCATLAGIASSIVHFLSVRSRIGESRDTLYAFAQSAVDMILATGQARAGK
ncbi:TetR/AcrR family transcriptional regulator [Microbaculum marinum]|uniref:TetR/AcrR family transcriptional regulator n=1 Tax=Microbaculum marinum TaxID=1764581 RepID=A0AAW9RXV2_9HYPH